MAQTNEHPPPLLTSSPLAAIKIAPLAWTHPALLIPASHLQQILETVIANQETILGDQTAMMTVHDNLIDLEEAGVVLTVAGIAALLTAPMKIDVREVVVVTGTNDEVETMMIPQPLHPVASVLVALTEMRRTERGPEDNNKPPTLRSPSQKITINPQH
jgi:hypothetical protein